MCTRRTPKHVHVMRIYEHTYTHKTHTTCIPPYNAVFGNYIGWVNCVRIYRHHVSHAIIYNSSVFFKEGIMFAKTFSKMFVKVSFGTILCSGAVLAFNSSEHWRMSRNIQRGKLFFPVKKQLDSALCPFPLPDIRTAVNGAPDIFCGLVGLKSNGKTSTLELVAKEQPNVVYLEMKANGNVCDELYESLKKSTFHFPWFLNRLRLDSSLTSRDIVKKVFRAVEKSSGSPVTAVIDIDSTEPRTTQSHLSSLSSPGVMEAVVRDPKHLIPSVSFDADARSFTRQVKGLVDSGVMRCLFAASEGASFQAEHARESRLELFMAGELSIPAAEKYLEKMHGLASNSEMKNMLSSLPRTFDNLRKFATASDKKAMVDSSFDELVGKIRKTLLIPGAKEVYLLALKRDIVVDDLIHLKFTLPEFEKVFVASNIFTLSKGGYKYRFQFGATAAAAKHVCNLRCTNLL